jgi:hypothetical protein
MSTVQSSTVYEFAFNYNDPNNNNGFGFLITEQAGFGDAEAFALEKAIMAALGTPAALSPVGNVTKSQLVTTQYQTNATAIPPSFT